MGNEYGILMKQQGGYTMNLKKIIATILAVTVMVSIPVTAMASGTSSNKPYLALGADLTDEQEATVLNLLGVNQSDLSNYTVVEITNAMEHEYLDSYLDSALIGTKALSSVLVTNKEKETGITVTTQNISYCTVGMYQNALATAGVENADIKVAGPFSISGTAGLVGAIKAYENMTGEKVDNDNVETATNELVVTSELGESLGDTGTAEELVGFIKNEVASNDYTEEEISSLIDDAATEFNVTLSAEDKQKIMDLMDKIDTLDLDVGKLQEQVEGLYDKLQNMDLNLNLDSQETQNFLTNLWNKISSFFTNLID